MGVRHPVATTYAQHDIFFIHIHMTTGSNGDCVNLSCDQHNPVDMCLGHKRDNNRDVRWLRLVGSLILQVSFAKEPYKRDDILQKRPMISRSLLVEATPYVFSALQGGEDP